MADHLSYSVQIAEKEYDLIDKRVKAAGISGDSGKICESDAIKTVYKDEIDVGYVNTAMVNEKIGLLKQKCDYEDTPKARKTYH